MFIRIQGFYYLYVVWLGYIKYRKLCGLSVPSNWNDRPKDINQENWENLKNAYEDVADIDAFTGGVSEEELWILSEKLL